MAKLSARGATVLWQVSKAYEPKGVGTLARYITVFYALRSDGKFLTRISIRAWNRYAEKWETDSGHWRIATAKDPAKIKELLIERGYSES